MKKLVFLLLCPLAIWTNAQQNTDWAAVGKFEEQNSKVARPAPGEHRVVFMGNSITEGWLREDSAFFAGKPYYDRGISGQTTPQMLVRFREDVVNLQPQVVLILGGINDIAENTGPEKLENIFGNIVSMVELAQAAHIRPVLCSVLPANVIPWRPSIVPTEKVTQLNRLLQAYAKSHKLVYADYYAALVDEEKGLPKKYSFDGVHPNAAGYHIMDGIAEKAIAAALSRQK